MANKSVTGFRPAGVAGNHIVVLRFPVTAAGNPTYNLFVEDVVSCESTGGVKPAQAGDGTIVVGVVTALYDSAGVPIGSPGSTESHKYLTAATAGYADVALALPDAIFVAQSQTSIAATDIFASIDNYFAAGDTTTNRSNHELAVASALNTDAQCQILGIVNSPDNAWGADVKVYLRFLESMWGQVNPTTGV